MTVPSHVTHTKGSLYYSRHRTVKFPTTSISYQSPEPGLYQPLPLHFIQSSLLPGLKMALTGRRCDATARPPEVSGGKSGSRLTLAQVVSRASRFEQESPLFYQDHGVLLHQQQW